MSLRLNQKDNYMRKYFLFGLLALGLIALGPTESRADEGFSIHIGPGYQQYRPNYYDSRHYRHYRHSDEYRWHRYHHWHHYDRDYDRD
jgi:hypothetical protein